MASSDDDVPLSDAHQHYERQFGDRIRGIAKSSPRPSAPAPASGGKGGGGRVGAGAIIVVVIVIIRAVIAVSNSSKHYEPTYTPPPPQFNPQPPFGNGDPLRQVEPESCLFEKGDLAVPECLCCRIYLESEQEGPTPGGRIWQFFDEPTRDLMRLTARGKTFEGRQTDTVYEALNALLDVPNLYEPKAFARLKAVPLEIDLRLRDVPVVPRDRDTIRSDNRALLEQAYPDQILNHNLRPLARFDQEQRRDLARQDLARAKAEFRPRKR